MAIGPDVSWDNVLDRTSAKSTTKTSCFLFLASFAALYFEMVVIRYLSTEIRIFAYLKNLALLACFFGIGYGMVVEKFPGRLKRLFPFITVGLFLLIAFAQFLHLTNLPIPADDYRLYTNQPIPPHSNLIVLVLWYISMLAIYLTAVPGIMYLVLAFFAVLGRLVGENLKQLPPLQGYGTNLAGSLLGVLAFTLLSFSEMSPAVWVAIGFVAMVPFFWQERWTLFAFGIVLCALSIPASHTYWSPYYRVTIDPEPPPQGWPVPAAFDIEVNHDFHQTIVNLSPEFVARFPAVEPNLIAKGRFDFPYRFVSNPGRVLIVGAGTGNDVAAALRHGATHIDAVEIDPEILRLGREYHPEHPYDSPKVSAFVDDARAYLQKTHEKYDLILFAALDSHTLLTAMSSIRLDDYVYTLESFTQARKLLSENGTMVVEFGSGRTFLSDRIFATLTRAFGVEPLAFYRDYPIPGIVCIEGAGAKSQAISGVTEISKELSAHRAGAILATDHWPFLYLETRKIPFAVWSVLLLFFYLAVSMMNRQVSLADIANREGSHLFLLGAGFMLLETKGVTELSLLFGSTWIVNAVVITAFLTMGLIANAFIMFRPVSRITSYACLLSVLLASLFVPYSLLEGLLPATKVILAGVLAGLPVFFSGLIFSRSFKEVDQPAKALGINLLGTVLGGVLENLVMVGGTQILGMIAIVLYALSAVCIRRAPARGTLWTKSIKSFSA